MEHEILESARSGGRLSEGFWKGHLRFYIFGFKVQTRAILATTKLLSVARRAGDEQANLRQPSNLRELAERRPTTPGEKGVLSLRMPRGAFRTLGRVCSPGHAAPRGGVRRVDGYYGRIDV